MSDRPPRRADRDPDAVGDVLDQLAAARGWAHGLALAKLRDRWEEVVGPILVSRCEPFRIDAEGCLVVRCDHGATANEVTMLSTTILGKVQQQLPAAGVVSVASVVRKRRDVGS